MEPVAVLVVDDSPGYADLLSLLLEEHGYQADVALTAAQALACACRRTYHVALIDIHLPDALGTEVLAQVRSLSPATDCVMMTAYSSTQTAVQAVTEGAYAYLVKPVGPADLLSVVQRAVERQRLVAENERIQNLLLERERHIAHTLQQSFLPELPASIQGLDVAVYYQAARDDARVGGDFYDVFTVSDDRVAVVVGDVSGKGLDAALDTALTRYALRGYAFEDPEPVSLLPRLNRLLFAETAPEGFVALSYAVLDPRARRLRYSCAGHEGPVLWRAASRTVVTLTSGGAAAGCVPDATYDEGETEWRSGDVLLLYTDGVTEARRGGEFLDICGLVALLVEHADSGSARGIVDGIRAGLDAYSGGRLRDDVALLAVRLP